MEFAVIFVEKVVEKLIDPVIRQFSYVFCYKSNIKSFTDGLKDLQTKKSDVMLSVDARNRNLDIIGPGVVSWLSKVEENEKKAREVHEGTEIVKNGCLNGWCPSLKQRYIVSRKAVKQMVVVKELQKDGEKHTQFAYPALPAGTVASTSTKGLEVFESRISQTKEVIEALKNESFSKIGVCGLGGVGKTRMAREIRDRAIAEDLFDEVAMAVVTENPDLEKIQDQLASMLGLTLEEKNITDVRGKQLCTRLTKGKRVLVILDDVWKRLDLGELGIPVGGQVESKRCKVLITSRDEHVCTTTGTEKNFAVKLLSDKEAWDLFKEKAGVIEETGDLHLIARKISEECGHLPLAIVTVGTALKGKENGEWQDALEQLEMSNVTSIEGMEKDVYSRLRLSYNLLESNQLRQLFLLCCMFPEDFDIPVEQLVRYAMGLRLFTDIPHLETVRKRVKSLVNQLKRCYLLLATDAEGHVKVHDVLRDFGLREASHGEHVYLVRHLGEVQQWLENDIIKTHTAISISSREELELPLDSVCPLLQLLELSSKGSIRLSKSYFGGMKELKVVSFRGQLISFGSEDMLIESSQKPLQFFMNVRTLCLEDCRFSTGIGFIGSMQKLEILSFSNSEKIDSLPSEIGQLNNLKLLDLRGCTVGLILSGVLSSLKKLEDLYMGCYFCEEGVEERNQGNCASIKELCSLSALKTLQVYISKPEVYSKLKDFFFDKLTRFDISINARTDNITPFSDFPNRATIKKIDLGLFVRPKIEALLRRVEVLHLSNVNGWDNIIKESDKDAYTNSKELYLSGQVRPPCFVNLRVFNITECHKIRSLFSPSAARCLLQLQELRISQCMMLEEVVFKDGAETGEDKKMIEFPKLKNISLYLLPCFRSFFSASRTICSEVSPNGCMFNKEVLLPSMETLHLSGELSDNTTLYLSRELSEEMNATDMGVTFSNLETLIDLEGVEVSDENAILGQLESIEIKGLCGLTQIWKNVPKQGLFEGSFHKLTVLHVTNCKNLRYLLFPSIAKILVNLREIELYYCPEIKQVIMIEEEEEEEENMGAIVFPQLHKLRLSGLSGLTSFCQGSHDLEFPKLDYVYVHTCINMNKFCFGALSAPKLDSVKYGFGRRSRVWMGDLNNTIQHIYKSGL